MSSKTYTGSESSPDVVDCRGGLEDNFRSFEGSPASSTLSNRSDFTLSALRLPRRGGMVEDAGKRKAAAEQQQRTTLPHSINVRIRGEEDLGREERTSGEFEMQSRSTKKGGSAHARTLDEETDDDIPEKKTPHSKTWFSPAV